MSFEKMCFERYYDGSYIDTGKTLAECEEADRIAQEENKKLTSWQDERIMKNSLNRQKNNYAPLIIVILNDKIKVLFSCLNCPEHGVKLLGDKVPEDSFSNISINSISGKKSKNKLISAAFQVNQAFSPPAQASFRCPCRGCYFCNNFIDF